MKKKLETYFDRLWPITRSLTGDGNRESLKILSEIIDLKITEVPSGTSCFDWEVPPEWNIKSAWIKDSKGQVIVDMAENNLHILGYSEAFNGKMSFKELAPHLYTLPDQPELIPYMTSYYKRRWGFCMAHDQFLKLDKSETYEVFIDSSLDKNGSMTVGEAVIEGKSKNEILFSTYICHPSMANNELSGPLVMALIYSELRKQKNLKYTYRFLFAPETIGALHNLSVYGTHWKNNLKAGYVVNCVGDPGSFTYKKSRIGNSLADRTAAIVLKQTEADYEIINFAPLGSDERQYCSPGFNLPVGSLMRTKHSTYPEYHTSADNKDFISFEAMQDSVLKYLDIVEILENNAIYLNTLPFGEPQLGKRGLYPTLSQKGERSFVDTMMWVLNLSDGKHDLIAISERSKIPIKELIPVVERLLEKNILKRLDDFKENDIL